MKRFWILDSGFWIGGPRRSRAQSRIENRKSKIVALVLWGVLAAPCTALAQQEEAPSVELSANLVTVTLVVRDASGALVTDLKPEDFAVYEDEALQEVGGFFRQQEIPLRLAFLFDTSLSVAKRLDFERRAAGRFFAQALRPGDEAALYSISTDPRLEQPLTPSAASLVAAAGRLKAGGITSLFAALDAAAKYLVKAQGRRVIVLLSDGSDTGSVQTMAEALESAQRADAVIYGIGSLGEGKVVSPTGRLGQETLQMLSGQTGGAAFFPQVGVTPEREASELDAAYAHLLEEVRAQYVLTYYSSNPARDGRFRRLRVQVRRPGLRVTARSGYYAN
jgi:Ca-activated chloride channel family protein